MIASYLDASAVVKRYVAEPGAEMIAQVFAEAPAIATSMISRVEVVTALGGASRRGALNLEDAETARRMFHGEWSGFIRIPVTEFLLERAALLGWEQGLRGYDAVQLTAAVTWREALDEAVAMVTFDRQLWSAAANVGLIAHPEHLPEILESWKAG